MRPVAGLVAVVAAGLASPVCAQAWVAARGHGQVIFKIESMRAEEGFDPSGERLPLPATRRDDAASVFVEWGVAPRLAVMVKGDWQRGRDAFVDYDGRGPLEVGVRWQAWRGDRWAVSLQGSVADGGEGRNAGYAAPGQGERDWEARVAVGRNFDLVGHASFAEVQTARRMRQGLPDETRTDATFGVRWRPDWLALTQVFAGQADDGGARWANLETSLIHDRGPWSFQLGWRSSLAGRETPISTGPVFGVWRRF